MPDWTKSMTQYYEFYKVDPVTWGNQKLLQTVESASLTRDLNTETLGSASFNISEMPGEHYIRTYLITVQNGAREQFCLGTYLVQSPSYSFDGARLNTRIDAYTALMELREQYPPFGYTVHKGTQILKEVTRLLSDITRVPVIGKYAQPTTLENAELTLYDHFTADPSDTWYSFFSKLLAKAKYRLDLDELGRIRLAPVTAVDKLHPIWIYDSGNSSILGSSITVDKDIYGIPNVVEVYYQDKRAIVKNTNSASPVSVQNRGREIVHRVVSPNLNSQNGQKAVDDYATQLLNDLSKVNYTISYTHGYAPVNIGDGVIIDCPKAGLNAVTAKVISQTINCTPGCQVSEKAIFAENLLEVK